VCVCVQLGRLTKSVLTSTVGFTSLTHTRTGERARHSKAQHGTARYSTIQQGTARYSKVQQGTAGSTVHHHTLPHITICRRAAGQHIQLSCRAHDGHVTFSGSGVVDKSSFTQRETHRKPLAYITVQHRNISAHHRTARHSTCSVAVIGMEYVGLVDVTVEGSASSCVCK